MGIDLPLVWMIIIGFGLMMYVIMDGFDLGIGMLLPLIRDRGDRDRMVNTVAPVWDGNETWLVLGGAGLLAAFPSAYSILLSALYFPLILMLVGLILRGVAFEFRFKAIEAHKPFWDKAFTWGSFIATLSQGVALGSIINGFAVSDFAYAGGALDFLSPFSVFTGLCLMVAYALLGATWLTMKTDGRIQEQMRGGGTSTRRALVGRHRYSECVDPSRTSGHRTTMVRASQYRLLQPCPDPGIPHIVGTRTFASKRWTG